MIVERFTWHVKPGHQQEFVELVKGERERIGKAEVRIYVPFYGPHNVVIGELEFETLEDQDGFWQEWWQAPEAQTYMEALSQLQDAGGSHELWILE
jgi:hypothetical protein